MEALVLLEQSISPMHGYPSWVARADKNDGAFTVAEVQDHALEALQSFQKANKSESPGMIPYVKFDES